MARYSCCGIALETEEAHREHRQRIHGETEAQTVDVPYGAAAPADHAQTPVGVGIIYGNRCKVCRTPIRGLAALPNRLRGIGPFAKNPQLCNT